MAFRDRFNKFIGGVQDIFSAPIGFLADTWAHSRDGDGLSGQELKDAMEKNAIKGMSGFGDVYQSSGLKGLLSHTPWVTENAKMIFDETELLWNHQLQKERDENPALFDATNKYLGTDIEPGEHSMAKDIGYLGGGLTGTVKNLSEGQSPFSDDVWDRRKTHQQMENTSPGQLIYERAIGLSDLPFEQQQEIKNSWEYVAVTGALDGLSRWKFDPLVVGGKATKKGSERYGHFLGVERVYKNARKKVERALGRELEGLDEIKSEARAYDAELGPALKEGENMYVIMDIDEARHAGLWDDATELNLRDADGKIGDHTPLYARSQALVEEASKNLPPEAPILKFGEGGEIYHYIDVSTDVERATAQSRELYDFFFEQVGGKGTAKLRQLLNPESNKLPNVNDLKTAYRLIDENWVKWVESEGNLGAYGQAKFLDNAFTEVLKRQAKEQGISPGRLGGFEKGGQYEKFYNFTNQRAKEIITELFLRKIDEGYPGVSTFTSRTAARTGSRVAEGEKGKIVFRNKEDALAAAKVDANYRKANQNVEASLGKHNLENPTVVVEINPEGLPVIIPRWDADGGWVLTDVNKIDKGMIVNKQVNSLADLEKAGDMPLSFWSDKGMRSPGVFENLDEARKANEGIVKAYENGGPQFSENMITDTIMKGEFGSLQEVLYNHPRILNAVEIMEGRKSGGFGGKGKMGASEIHKYFFKNTPDGDLISSILYHAKGTEAKMEVLLAFMGIRLPKNIAGVPGAMMEQLHSRAIQVQRMNDRVSKLKNTQQQLSSNTADSHVRFRNAMEGELQVGRHVKDYRKMEEKSILGERLKPSEMKTIDEIDDYLDNLFPDRNKKLEVDEHLIMNADEAEKILLDLEYQEAMLKKAETLSDKNLSQSIAISTADEMKGILEHVPHASLGKKIQYAIRTSNFYQTAGGPIKWTRSVVEMQPRSWLNLSASDGHVQIERLVKEANARFRKQSRAKNGKDLFSPEEITAFMDDFLTKRRDVDRFQLILRVNSRIIEEIGKLNDLPEAEVRAMINEMGSGINRTRNFLESRRYGPQSSKEVRKALEKQGDDIIKSVDSEVGHYGDTIQYYDSTTGTYSYQALPLLGTQLANWVPLPDLRLLQKEIVKRNDLYNLIGFTKASEALEAVGDSFYSVWKPSVLLRGGWPIRFVADEQFRILARGISLLDHIMAISKTEKSGKILFDTQVMKAWKEGKKGGKMQATGAALGFMLSSPVRLGTGALLLTSKVASKIIELVPGKRQKSHFMDELGGELEPLVSARAGFATPTDNILEQYGSFFTKQELGAFNKYEKTMKTGEYRAIAKGDEGYASGWLRALNNQIMRDPLGRRSVKAALVAVDEVMKLYKNPTTDQTLLIMQKEIHKEFRAFFKTEKGIEYLNQMPWRGPKYKGDDWLEIWADDILDMTAQYTMLSTGGPTKITRSLLNELNRGKLSSSTLSKIPEQYRPSVIHGEQIAQILGTHGPLSSFFRGFLVEGFEGFGRLPSDVLSRNPMLRSLFANEVGRRSRLAAKQGQKEFTVADINRVTRQAKKGALEEAQRYMYNIAETPRAASTFVRFLVPFLGANVEIFKVWSGLVRRDPSIIGRANLIWKSPERAINTPDGFFQGDGGGYTIITEDERGNKYLTFTISEAYKEDKDLYGWKKYLADSTFKFGKNSFNMITQNPIGNGGPIVQMAFNEVAIRNPELEKTLIGEFVLSWGVKGGTSVSARLLGGQSPAVRTIAEELDFIGDFNGQKRKIYNDVISYHDTRVRLGEADPMRPEEIMEEAWHVWALYSIVKYFSPASPIVESPLVPYIEAYRDLVEQHGSNEGTELFIQQYGDEYFTVTKGKTTSKTGLPPTQEAEEAREPFKRLLIDNPEYSRLIMGDIYDVGEFSSAVYAAQMSSTIDREFGKEMLRIYGPEREYKEYLADDFLPDGRIKEVDADLGWQKFGKLMNEVDAYRIQYGWENLHIDEAEPLVEWKNKQLDQIFEDHPAFRKAFYQNRNVDPDKWAMRINKMTEIVEAVLDPAVTSDISTRPDLMGLMYYIDLRNYAKELLAEREFVTLDAKDNADFKLAFEKEVAKILDKYPEFINIYYRYLEGDPLR